jgi:hypothetical protein
MNVSVIADTSAIDPVQPQRGVDAVGQQVARHAGTGRLDVQPPGRHAALRHVGGDGPVLQELRSVVEDLAQATFVDQLLGQRHCRDAAIVERDQIRHLGGFDRQHHLLGLRRVQGQRLFAQDRLAGLGRRDRDLGVHVVRHADVDQIDV